MNQPFQIVNDESIPCTHFFAYKNKKYPFNFDFFKYISNYFNKKQSEFQNFPIIDIIDNEFEGGINLSDESINDFINFCHNKRIEINDQNGIGLNYLAKKYEVNSLTKNTEYFISIHTNHLILQKLSLFSDHQGIETQKYEDMIAEKFTDYIDDDRLLLLSIPTLHRILTKYLLKNNKIDIFPFLFKCLDKFGVDASVLFSDVDFGNEKVKNINILLTKYSKIFDFHFIHPAFIETLYETQNVLIQKEAKMEKQQKEFSDFVMEQFSQMKREMEIMKEEHQNEIQNLKKTNEEKVNILNQQIIEMKNEINEINQNYSIEIENLKMIDEENINERDLQISQMNDLVNKLKIDFKENINQAIQLKQIIYSTINIEFFNHLDGSVQIDVINELFSRNKSKLITNIYNLLSYLSNEYHKLNLNFDGSNKIFIPTHQIEEKIVSLNELIDELNSIGISKEIIDVFHKNKLNSEEFTSKIKQFDQIYLEIQYPSNYFDNVIKRITDTEVKINVAILETPKEHMTFKDNSNICSAIFNDAINTINSFFFQQVHIIKKRINSYFFN